jgi:hypothetical protein
MLTFSTKRVNLQSLTSTKTKEIQDKNYGQDSYFYNVAKQHFFLRQPAANVTNGRVLGNAGSKKER